MAKIILFSPAISTLNRGDEIITQACKNNLKFDGKEDFCIEISTHLPLLNNYFRIIGQPKCKIVLGSNLLRGRINRKFKPWHITLKNIKYLKNTILMGVGWWTYNDSPNLFTKLFYKAILSKTHLHSVRDEYTKKMLESIGIKNVINTGCPTMWGLTESHCQSIPKQKAQAVVFTLTDYNRDYNKDRELVDILLHHYEKVYFWIQGWGDKDYLEDLLKDDVDVLVNFKESNAKTYNLKPRKYYF